MEVKEKTLGIKEKILREAQAMFWKFGVKSVTMDDIAKHLGMSKKTLYQFFNDKDDIICQITTDFLKNKECEVDEIRESAQDALHELFMMSKHIKSSFENMSSSLMYELKKYHPKAFKIFLDHKRTCLLESIVKNLENGINEGVYRSDMDVAVMAKLRMEQVEMGFDQNIFPSKEFKLDHVQMQLFDHFIHGITTLKGHKLLNKYRHINEED